ncbi:MAG: hypothetical protein M3Y91_09030 [Actinomycetota bacterium]|nr:hypothetical protein [Actinomycetota bacterium]
MDTVTPTPTHVTGVTAAMVNVTGGRPICIHRHQPLPANLPDGEMDRLAKAGAFRPAPAGSLRPLRRAVAGLDFYVDDVASPVDVTDAVDDGFRPAGAPPPPAEVAAKRRGRPRKGPGPVTAPPADEPGEVADVAVEPIAVAPPGALPDGAIEMPRPPGATTVTLDSEL